ncbi:Zn-binding domain-containing protein [Sporosarcina sp. P37]|uniref:Zn-binding domain-containing protein n=2 Tax=unclassified Sporosarcina TaxID=2647733 RepID=UPI000A19D52B|nr:DUF1998 domain-containing protein [Sporosarcina sp. P35]
MHTSGTWLTFDVPDDWEKSELTDAMTAAAYAIQSLVPLFIKCDRTDIHVVPQVKAIHMERPTFFIYDSYPGGIGLSENIYPRWRELLTLAADHVAECLCEHGCPVCIGAQEAGQKDNKHRAHSLLAELAK